ncbi:Mpo1-like protein [Serratia marcescens]|uniref:Mpo1-like protein n=1 Tax=Serratia marcescens TaxID=615 RepID=UPI001FB5B0ED|nr:Mpo1-like protein [Serratia marcescens]
MRSLEDHLAAYAAYHRDARNIATHFIGIPLIVISLLALLSRPAWGAGGLPFSPACAAVIVSAASSSAGCFSLSGTFGRGENRRLWTT